MSDSDNVVPFPGDHPGGGGGPEDPMLEQRVARLEEDVREIKSDLRDIRNELGGLRTSVAEIKGAIDMLVKRTPDAAQLWRMVIGTWIAGAGVVALAVKLIQ